VDAKDTMMEQLSRLHALPSDLERYLYLRRLHVQDSRTFYQVSDGFSPEPVCVGCVADVSVTCSSLCVNLHYRAAGS